MYEKTGEIYPKMYLACLVKDDVETLEALTNMKRADLRYHQWGGSNDHFAVRCAAYYYQVDEKFQEFARTKFKAVEMKFFLELILLDRELKQWGINDLMYSDDLNICAPLKSCLMKKLTA